MLSINATYNCFAKIAYDQSIVFEGSARFEISPNIWYRKTSYQPMIFLFTVILWIACLILGVCKNQRSYNFRISIKWCVFALDFSQWKGELFTFWRVCVHMTACKRTHAFPALLNVCILSTQHKDFSILVYIRQLYRLQLKFTLI